MKLLRHARISRSKDIGMRRAVKRGGALIPIETTNTSNRSVRLSGNQKAHTKKGGSFFVAFLSQLRNVRKVAKAYK